jgi:hypothetical protein
MSFDNHPSQLPTVEIWQYRRDLFAYYVGQAIGDDYVGTSSTQSTILELELERVFCSGAWLATVILACAASEVYLHAKDQRREAKFLSEYKLREDWLWLKRTRNQLVHLNNSLSYDDYMHAPKTLEDEAKRAVQVALKVILLGTRVELDDSIKRTET